MTAKTTGVAVPENQDTIGCPQASNACVRPAEQKDLATIVELHRRAFGPGRFALTAYRVREGTPPISRFCRIAELDGRLIAAVRMTLIEIGGSKGALLLGPLAVEPAHVNQGHGRALISAAIAAAREQGLALVVLVGNASYYGRFGFAPVPAGQITFPGPVDPARTLAFEIVPGALASFHGVIRAADPGA
ncbi:MAG: N-acetyltransferase [Alphaproteobacteria bacterium]|nr:N-acetyltransferase [Alphaproteobacteria bacterium]